MTAYVAGLGPMPISVVRDAMDDAFLVGVVMKGTEVAKIRRFGRRFGPEIRDALLADLPCHQCHDKKTAADRLFYDDTG